MVRVRALLAVGFGEVQVPGRFFPVDGHYSGTGTVGVRCWHVPDGTSAESRVRAGGNLGRVFNVFWELCPDDVGGHKGEGASGVVLGTLVPCLGLGVLEPVLEVSSRVVDSLAREWVE